MSCAMSCACLPLHGTVGPPVGHMTIRPARERVENTVLNLLPDSWLDGIDGTAPPCVSMRLTHAADLTGGTSERHLQAKSAGHRCCHFRIWTRAVGAASRLAWGGGRLRRRTCGLSLRHPAMPVPCQPHPRASPLSLRAPTATTRPRRHYGRPVAIDACQDPGIKKFST